MRSRPSRATGGSCTARRWRSGWPSRRAARRRSAWRPRGPPSASWRSCAASRSPPSSPASRARLISRRSASIRSDGTDTSTTWSCAGSVAPRPCRSRRPGSCRPDARGCGGGSREGVPGERRGAIGSAREGDRALPRPPRGRARRRGAPRARRAAAALRAARHPGDRPRARPRLRKRRAGRRRGDGRGPRRAPGHPRGGPRAPRGAGRAARAVRDRHVGGAPRAPGRPRGRPTHPRVVGAPRGRERDSPRAGARTVARARARHPRALAHQRAGRGVIMAFAPLLRAILEGCRGGLGAALLGYDGMPFEEVVAAGAPDSLHEELSTAGVEFGRILADIRKASDALAGGALLDVTIRLSRMSFVFCGVDDEILIAVAVAPDGNTGQARYLIRRQMPALRAEL